MKPGHPLPAAGWPGLTAGIGATTIESGAFGPVFFESHGLM